MNYYHLHVKGYPNGYYEENRAWEITRCVPHEQIKFMAGPFTLEDINELRKQTKAEGRKPLPVVNEAKL